MRDASLLLQTESGIEDLTAYVSRFVFKSSLLLGRTVWSMKFASPLWDFWQQFMVGKGLTFNVKLQASRNDTESESPWLALAVDQSKAMLRPGKIYGTVSGGGGELQMMVQAKRKAYFNQTPTSVIQQIATSYALNPSVDATSLTKNWYQANKSDWEFLQEIMDYFIPSTTNRGDAFLNVEGMNLTVKPIEFAKPAVRKYDFSSGDDDRVVKVGVRYYGGQVDRKGGIVTEVRGFDETKGLPVTWTVSPATSSQPALASKLPKRITTNNRVVLDPHPSLDFIKARALREQARNGTRNFGIAIKVINDLTINLRDMIEISAADDDGVESPYRGRYGVYEYTFDYRRGGVDTTVVGFRKESYEGEQQATGADLSRSSGTDLQKARGQEQTKKVAVPI